MKLTRLSTESQEEIEQIYNMTFTYENLSQIHVRETERSKVHGSINLLYTDAEQLTTSNVNYCYDSESESFERKLTVNYFEGEWSTLLEQEQKKLDPEDLLNDLTSLLVLMKIKPY